MLRENPPPPGGGGVRGQKKVCVPKIGIVKIIRKVIKISGPFDKFHFLSEEDFSDVGAGGGGAGPAEAGQCPKQPPPEGGSLGNGLHPRPMLLSAE